MTTFTTEDRQNASPPHVIDSGASITSLTAYIELEQRIEMYRNQIHIMQAEIQRLKRRLIELGETE